MSTETEQLRELARLHRREQKVDKERRRYVRLITAHMPREMQPSRDGDRWRKALTKTLVLPAA